MGKASSLVPGELQWAPQVLARALLGAEGAQSFMASPPRVGLAGLQLEISWSAPYLVVCQLWWWWALRGSTLASNRAVAPAGEAFKRALLPDAASVHFWQNPGFSAWCRAPKGIASWCCSVMDIHEWQLKMGLLLCSPSLSYSLRWALGRASYGPNMLFLVYIPPIGTSHASGRSRDEESVLNVVVLFEFIHSTWLTGWGMSPTRWCWNPCLHKHLQH